MTHILFYKQNENPFGIFSNFYQKFDRTGNPMPLFADVNGVLYNCSEQYMMKKKQELFDSQNELLARSIMLETNPVKIKALGRKVKYFDQSVWNANRFQIVFDACYYKFSSSNNSEMKNILLSTENKIIVECSSRDSIWGSGMNADKVIANEYSFPGMNLLGQILMLVRKHLSQNN